MQGSSQFAEVIVCGSVYAQYVCVCVCVCVCKAVQSAKDLHVETRVNILVVAVITVAAQGLCLLYVEQWFMQR